MTHSGGVGNTGSERHVVFGSAVEHDCRPGSVHVGELHVRFTSLVECKEGYLTITVLWVKLHVNARKKEGMKRATSVNVNHLPSA